MAGPQLDVDFFEPSFLEDPYATYDRIRDVSFGPVWNAAFQGWMVVGYDEGSTVIADTSRFRSRNDDPEITPWFEAPNMIAADGDLHKRLRGALSPMFTRSASARWEAKINEVVAAMLEPLVAGNDSFDLIADFTKVPTIIVSEMLGIPADRHDDFMDWSHAIVTNLSYGLEDEERRAVLAKASRELNDYMKGEIERHRRDRPDDLITAMLDLTGDHAMSDGEIRSTGILLLVAGYDTTAKTMSSCLVALEQNPEQRALVADDPALVPAAIEECMRWLGPVQWGPRRVEQDTELAGAELAAGDHIYTFTAAANRDPRRWEHADELDVVREPKAHLAFGYGPHLCLGAPLARLEVRVALEQLLRLAPEYRLRDVDFGNSAFIRGPERGRIEVGARTGSRVPCTVPAMSGAPSQDEGEPTAGTRRRYDSPIRRQRAAQTRERIVAAGAELARSFPTWDWNDLTFAAVAERAGVGERTVYRYFPTEQQLHDGVMQRLEDEAGVSYEGIGLDEVAEVASRVYAALGSFSVAGAGFPDDPSFVAEDDRRRRALLDAVGRSAGHWPAARRERAAAAVDVLWSMSSYERLIGAWRMDSREANDIVGWLVRLVVEAIERDDGPPATRRRARTLHATKAPNRPV